MAGKRCHSADFRYEDSYFPLDWVRIGPRKGIPLPEVECWTSKILDPLAAGWLGFYLQFKIQVCFLATVDRRSSCWILIITFRASFLGVYLQPAF